MPHPYCCISLHSKSSEPEGKCSVASITVVTPHDGVASAGTAVNTAMITSAGAMRSDRICGFLKLVSEFMVFSFLFLVYGLVLHCERTKNSDRSAHLT